MTVPAVYLLVIAWLTGSPTDYDNNTGIAFYYDAAKCEDKAERLRYNGAEFARCIKITCDGIGTKSLLISGDEFNDLFCREKKTTKR